MASKLKLSDGLLSAMREQRAILFLGSGASLRSKTPAGKDMPTAKKLSEDIADRFLASKFKNKPLMRVAELARSQAGSNVLNQWLRDYFDPFEPTSAHNSLPHFRWRVTCPPVVPRS